MLCCGYTLTDFPLSIRLTSLAQSNDCPSASKATLMNMDKYFMWIHYERLHNHYKVKHNKTCAYFLGYTVAAFHWFKNIISVVSNYFHIKIKNCWHLPDPFTMWNCIFAVPQNRTCIDILWLWCAGKTPLMVHPSYSIIQMSADTIWCRFEPEVICHYTYITHESGICLVYNMVSTLFYIPDICR